MHRSQIKRRSWLVLSILVVIVMMFAAMAPALAVTVSAVEERSNAQRFEVDGVSFDQSTLYLSSQLESIEYSLNRWQETEVNPKHDKLQKEYEKIFPRELTEEEKKKLKEEKLEHTADTINAINQQLPGIINIAKDFENGGDFDTAGCIKTSVQTVSSILSALGPTCKVVGASLDLLVTLGDLAMGGTAASSEAAQMEDRLNQQFDDLKNDVAELKGLVTDLSDEIHASTNRIITEMSAALDRQDDKEQMRQFLMSYEGNFSYNQFRNYIYGDMAHNSRSATAYRARLEDALINGGSETLIRHCYDDLYGAIIANMPAFEDYLAPEDANIQSIIVTYHDYLASNPSFTSQYGLTPEEATVQFAYELYQTLQEADIILLTCNTYQLMQMLLAEQDLYESYNGDFTVSPADIEAMYTAVEAREEKVLTQIAKDLTYVLGLCDFYIVEDGGRFYEVAEGTDGFGTVLPDQTVYFNQMPESICTLFGLDMYDYTYAVSYGDRWIPFDGYIRANADAMSVALQYEGQAAQVLSLRVTGEADSAGGSGTPEDPYLIGSPTQFLRIGDHMDGHFRLIRDIDFGGATVSPLGCAFNENGGETITEFTGTLDGNGYALRNLCVEGGRTTGLFAAIGDSGVITHVTMENARVSAAMGDAPDTNSTYSIGSFCGVNNGRIKDCAVIGNGSGVSIKADNQVPNRNITVYAGGVAGINNCLISACRVEGVSVLAESHHSFGGDRTETNRHYVYAGGLVGCNNDRVGYSYVDADTVVTAHTVSALSPKTTVNPYLGGLAGGIAGKIGNGNARENMHALYTEARTVGYADIRIVDSNWGAHERNRVQNSDAETNCYVPAASSAPVEQMRIAKADILDFFSTRYHAYQVTLNGVTQVLPADADTLSSDALTVQVTDASDGTQSYEVESFSVINLYGFTPYNDSEVSEKPFTAVFLLRIDLKDGTQLHVRKEYACRFEKNRVVAVEIQTEFSEYEVDDESSEILLSELNGSHLSYRCVYGSYAGSFDAAKLTDPVVRTERLVACEACGSYDVQTSKVGSSIAYECREAACKHTGILPIFEVDGLYRGELGRYRAVISGIYNGVAVTFEYDYVVTCKHLRDEVGYLQKVLTVEPNCLSLGYTEFKCTYCEEVIHKNYTRKTDVHTFETIDRHEPTCYAEGFSGRVICGVCGLVEDEGHTLPKRAHDYSVILYEEVDGVITTDEHGNKLSYRHQCAHDPAHIENHQYRITEGVLQKETGEYYILYTYSCDCGYFKQIPDENTIVDENRELPTVMVSDGYVTMDGSHDVTVYVQLLNNPGVYGGVFGIRYDDRLVLKSHENGSILEGTYNDDQKNEVNAGHNFVWANAKATEEDGNLLKLVFTVPADAKEGDSYTVSVVYTDLPSLVYDPTSQKEMQVIGGFDVVGNTEAQRFITRDGRITIVDRLPGDVNNDKVVDMVDAIIIGQVMVGKDVPDWSAENVIYADVDLNRGLSAHDLVIILQSLTGGYGSNLLSHEFQVYLNGNGYLLDQDVLNVSIYNDYNNTYSRAGLTDLEQMGYKFDGWWTKPVGGEQIILGDGSMASDVQYFSYQKKQMLYARWTLNSVTLDGNGATNTVEEPSISYSEDYVPGAVETHFEQKYSITFVDNGEGELQADITTWLEYGLIAWEDASGNRYAADLSDLDLSAPNIGELTLYAIWDEGTLEFPEWDKTPLGYSFNKWTTTDGKTVTANTPEANTAIRDKAQGVGHETTVHASFSAIQYTISFDANGGDGTKTSERKNVASNQILSANTSITRTGYRFDGWATDPNAANAEFKDQDNISRILHGENAEIVLYAIWKPVVYYVEYTANYTGGTTTKTQYTYGSFTFADEIARPGYTFAGWAIEPKGRALQMNAAEAEAYLVDLFKIEENYDIITLYAFWEVDPYVIGKYVSNGSVVSNSDGENAYTVYTSINGTGWAPLTSNGRAIVYWADEPGTEVDMLTYTDRYVLFDNGKGRYNNIDIWHDEIDEIIFIGSPNKTYINLCMHLCNYTNGRKLTMKFVDFNFISNEFFAIQQAITIDGTTPDIDLTIEVVGNCSIGSSYSGGTALYLPNQRVTLTGIGTMSLSGGNGAGAGTDGGVAINVGGLTVDLEGDLIVRGGDGADGANGTHESEAGGAGGNGGMAVYCEYFMDIDKYANVLLLGGNGGDGGNGGGGNWYTWDGYADLPDGANGGNGGNGGAPISSFDYIILYSTQAAIACQYGNGGDGGNGGMGCNATWEAGAKPDTGGDGGTGGNGGYGYEGGKGGDGGTGGYSFANEHTDRLWGIGYNKEWQYGQCGSGGHPGNGGDSISILYFRYGAEGVIAGLAGSGGVGGAAGEKGTKDDEHYPYAGTDRTGITGTSGENIELSF